MPVNILIALNIGVGVAALFLAMLTRLFRRRRMWLEPGRMKRVAGFIEVIYLTLGVSAILQGVWTLTEAEPGVLYALVLLFRVLLGAALWGHLFYLLATVFRPKS